MASKAILLKVSDPGDTLAGTGFAAVLANAATLLWLLDLCRRFRAAQAAFGAGWLQVAVTDYSARFHDTLGDYDGEDAGRMEAISDAEDDDPGAHPVADFLDSDEDGPTLVDADLLPEDGIRTECDEVVIAPYSPGDPAGVLQLCWRAYRKHCDTKLETIDVRSDYLEALLAEIEGGT